MASTRFSCLASALVVAGCYDALTPEPKNMVRWDAENVKAYVATARDNADVVFGWEFSASSEVARWRECSSTEQCTTVARERPAADVLAVEHTGQGTLPNGTKVDVVKLSLSPRRKYVVPAVHDVPAR